MQAAPVIGAESRLLAHGVILLLRSNLIAFGVKRTSITEGQHPRGLLGDQPLEARMAQQPFSVTPRNSSRAENFGSTQTVSFRSSSFAVGGVAPASAGSSPVRASFASSS